MYPGGGMIAVAYSSWFLLTPCRSTQRASRVRRWWNSGAISNRWKVSNFHIMTIFSLWPGSATAPLGSNAIAEQSLPRSSHESAEKDQNCATSVCENTGQMQTPAPDTGYLLLKQNGWAVTQEQNRLTVKRVPPG